MIVLSHPTGNVFVRALLQALEQAGMDFAFHTTLVSDPTRSWTKLIPASLRRELGRRRFDVARARCHQRPGRELARLLCSRLHLAPFVRHESGPFSVDAIYRDLDRHVAQRVDEAADQGVLESVYAYEDGARDTFAAAKRRGIQCCYELPIAYWETSRQLLREEAERWPEWEPTLMGTRDSSFKQERKAEELELADVVICPSQFVCRSLPAAVKNHKPCVIAEFGSPEVLPATRWRTEPDLQRPLRLLFAGSMSQRKGLADLFAALRSLRRPDVELVVLGTPLMPMRFYRRQFPSFIYERSRSHEEVLGLMQRCDVLVLPSIVEGRALVQQEALSCGLPLIVTAHAGGEDLIEEGRTGFLVPIRDPETLAARIAWCADHRLELEAMRGCARRKAADYTWRGYAEKILSALPVGRAETAAAA